MLNFSLGMRNICPTKSSANLFNWLAIFEPSAIKLVFSIRNGSSGNLSRFLDRQSWMDLWSLQYPFLLETILWVVCHDLADILGMDKVHQLDLLPKSLYRFRGDIA